MTDGARLGTLGIADKGSVVAVRLLGGVFVGLTRDARIVRFPILLQLLTAGLALDDNSGARRHSGCRCPISIPRPDLESS